MAYPNLLDDDPSLNTSLNVSKAQFDHREFQLVPNGIVNPFLDSSEQTHDYHQEGEPAA